MAAGSIPEYEVLLETCQCRDEELTAAYRQLRALLERLCEEQMAGADALMTTDLSARIGYVATIYNMGMVEQNRLHDFRLTSNDILNRRVSPTRQHLLRDVKTLAHFVRLVRRADIPVELARWLPASRPASHPVPPPVGREKRLRVSFVEADETFLYVQPTDRLADQRWRVRYHVAGVNDEFADTVRLLWPNARLNLLDVSIDAHGVLTPGFIILEPDYLIDISSLAECYKAYGHHPANYLLQRLVPQENTPPLLLGNMANYFLDRCVHADSAPDYGQTMSQGFKLYPLHFAACTPLNDPAAARQFSTDCRKHFQHISAMVGQTFREPGYGLDKTDVVLEPTYLCEPLGLQGRLDYMQRDMRSFIEMKSGKADEYALPGRIVPGENHRVQMLLYQAVLEYTMGIDHRQSRAYLLYTRYPLLYPARPSWAMLRRIMNLRNRIVATEHAVQQHGSVDFTAGVLDQINPTTLNERQLGGRLWTDYLSRPIAQFRQRLAGLKPLERAYFYALYSFITTELYTAKSGCTDSGSGKRGGASSLWLSTIEEKLEAGELLLDLQLVENRAHHAQQPRLVLVAPPGHSFLPPNFREGDAVLLYRRDRESDNVSNQMVFKATIDRIEGSRYTLSLRQAQQNAKVLPDGGRYALEHDFMDTAYRQMYQGLALFLQAPPSRRALILGQREPQFDTRFDAAIAAAGDDDFKRVALKAQAARDFFLLLGPPGTGKTSWALRGMVQALRAEGKQLLLLSYTNRAVDEMCKMLDALNLPDGYMRVGTESACATEYRTRLMDRMLQPCASRQEVRQLLQRCPVVVGTVSALSARSSLFALKTFDVALVDEATQILEPQLLPLLCMPGADGSEAIGRFVLIGDHKQLPAVVQQPAARSEVRHEGLRQMGLLNLRDSLFERLYRMFSTPSSAVLHRAYDMLRRQGRMNPEVALFSNRAFYGGALQMVGLPHQTDRLQLASALRRHPYASILTCRMAFIPSEPQPPMQPVKTNRSEACIAARLAVAIYRQYEQEGGFLPDRTLGIITPYRSQIALIRQELQREAAADPLMRATLMLTTVDTVERYQGSERDVMIYSFCVNRPYQLELLSNMTTDNGTPIDRKLNVALTRARRQMFLTGVPSLLQQNPLYASLLEGVVWYRS